MLTLPSSPGVVFPEALERSAHHLTPEQIQFFDENGYLILRNLISGELLTRLQKAATDWIDQGWEIYNDNDEIKSDWESDWSFAKRTSGYVMYRVNYLHNKHKSASLELLGCPQVLGVAESLSGRNFVPTYESMVFKQQGDGEAIVWHQDAIHPRNYRIFNLDLYLDPSTPENGALRVLPKTQLGKADHCQLTNEHGWNPPGVITVDMQPGDVLLHDVMVVHGSPRVEGQNLRRTIYYEFRAAEQIMAEGPWDREWIERRMRLIPVALNRYREAFPDADQFIWRADDTFRPVSSGDDEVELKVVHVVHTQGAFCSAGDVPSKN